MEKLIELLDKFRKENKTKELFGEPGTLVPLTGKDFIELNRVMIISKEYEFIKWLVENDKIDRENWGLLDNCMSEFDRYPISFDNKKLNDKAIDMLLMLLSISSSPIEDLISYLK